MEAILTNFYQTWRESKHVSKDNFKDKLQVVEGMIKNNLIDNQMIKSILKVPPDPNNLNLEHIL